MSLITDLLGKLGQTSVGGVSLAPKIVVIAPDGRQLWIDPAAVASTPPSNGPLSRFAVTTQLGDVPQNDPNVTSDPTVFATWEIGALLLTPGPLGLPYVLWAALLGYGGYRLLKGPRK